MASQEAAGQEQKSVDSYTSDESEEEDQVDDLNDGEKFALRRTTASKPAKKKRRFNRRETRALKKQPFPPAGPPSQVDPAQNSAADNQMDHREATEHEKTGAVGGKSMTGGGSVEASNTQQSF